MSHIGETHQPSWRQLRDLVVRSLPASGILVETLRRLSLLQRSLPAHRDSGVWRRPRLDDDPGPWSSVQRIGLIVQSPLQLLPDDAGPLGPHSGDLAEFAGARGNDAAQRPEVIDDGLGRSR